MTTMAHRSEAGAPAGSGLPSRYDPAASEPGVYELWLASGAFSPSEQPPPGAERFVIIMPPPNVTGSLHTGHALTDTVEDILVRYHRMRGDDTLWLPGVDHASIAAQFVLDQVIAAEGETRESLGRERYLERMWRYMDETRDIITRQHHKLGASADWSRTRFTMDDGSARAVRTAFMRLWDAGLVYRDEALINWCPRCRTSISDLENVHREESGTLWTVRYPLEGADGLPSGDERIEVATTRPETILGDVAVAVHPDDERYRPLVGRHAILPFLGRRLPIIADETVDRAFGTGAVKITPAHDPTDYEIGKRHGLAAISILDADARVTPEGGPFAGLDRFEARREIVDRLRSGGGLTAETAHRMVVGHCDRCDTVVEPRLSTQWFVRASQLAGPAIASVRDGRTRIVPERYTKVYFGWLENIRDWNVSRQLWWGHRIPAWFCPDGHITVSDEEAGPGACGDCGSPGDALRQEDDIFDTWFSSGLWPFSTLGWPDRTPDFERFYPTSVMETGYDILFFWVARMMMLGLFCTGVEPFHTVYLHGMVRDPYGKKMSKTKGNVVDPLQVIDEVGADALRFALVAGVGAGNDQRLSRAKLDGARNFTNKLWNAARFVLSARPSDAVEPEGTPTLPERWIRSRLAAVTDHATGRLDELSTGDYAQGLHDFAWGEYCDWLIELAKVDLRRPDTAPAERARVWRALAESLATLLRLLHPVMPFVTERIWQALHEAEPSVTGDELLIRVPWPEVGTRDAAAEADMDGIIELVRAIRNLRTEHGAPASEWLELDVVPRDSASRGVLEGSRAYVEALAHVRPIALAAPGAERPAGTRVAAVSLGTAALRTPAGEGPDRRPSDRQLDELRRRIERLQSLLADEAFATRAPSEIVDRERGRLAELEDQLAALQGRSSQ